MPPYFNAHFYANIMFQTNMISEIIVTPTAMQTELSRTMYICYFWNILYESFTDKVSLTRRDSLLKVYTDISNKTEDRDRIQGF